MVPRMSPRNTTLITCAPVDRTDPAIADLPDAVRVVLSHLKVGPGYTMTTCDECHRRVHIGPVQRSKAERIGYVKIICYICVDPAVLLAYVNQPAH